ncbi:MAG: sulfatase-like hydrolase/transferase [Selenomonadaceae bacterium]|nr:sulfatase-like hydrolase/transferase [Selenomonadaceae bacterium]
MRLETFWRNIQQDLKLFFLLLLLLCLFRAYFMGYMSGYMKEATDSGEVLTALWMGLRLSLKSAGALTLPAFAFGSLPAIAFPRLNTDKFRLWWGTAAAFFLSVCFQARFPYYRQFRSAFDMHVLMGWQDDRMALFFTMVEEYGLWWRLLLAVGLAICFFIAWQWLLKRGTVALPLAPTLKLWQQGAFAAGLAVCIFLFGLFVRFGGSFNYEKGVSFLSAGVTGDEFLNECILDDVQALYRVKSFADNMQTGNIAGVEPEKVREFAQAIAGHEDLTGSDLRPYLERKAAGAKLEKPEHIFLILGESWANWPLLPKYAPLQVAENIKALREAPNAYATDTFLPTGNGTAIALSGVITGLAAVNISPQYQPQSFAAPYITAFAPQFKKLGYQVDFWYGGISSWDGMNRFALAQGFDNFYGYPDFHAPRQNAWGTKDGYLFDALKNHLAEESPTVHLVMTTTNHPPYNLDLAAEGFAVEKEKSLVTSVIDSVEDPAVLATELGHYWYMDKVVGEFVREVSRRYPKSLFVITGDHATRTDPGTRPTIYEHEGIPFVLYGAGVTKDILPTGAVGSQLSILPTLLELIAPEGFAYYSLVPSLTEGTAATQSAFSSDAWITNRVIGETGGTRAEILPGASQDVDVAAEKEKLAAYLPMIRTLSWWLLEKGDSLEE